MYTSHKIDRSAIKHASKLLREGKLVAFPTETVYGLGADAGNPSAIQKIYTVKKRPPTNPLIIHLSHHSAIKNYAVNIPIAAYALAEAFWPGPLTLVLPKHPDVLLSVTAQQDSVALRIPNHPVALALLEEFGGGIAAPSANRYNCLSPTQALHVQKALGDEVDLILEGGDCQVGIESTIVSLLNERPQILRQGHIKPHEIETVLGMKLFDSLEDDNFKSDLKKQQEKQVAVPGQNLKHYAPSKPLYLVTTQELIQILKASGQADIKISSCSILSFSSKEELLANNDIKNIPWITLSKNPVLYAAKLYAALHELDQSTANCILVEAPMNTIEWQAINDRLLRASTTGD